MVVEFELLVPELWLLFPCIASLFACTTPSFPDDLFPLEGDEGGDDVFLVSLKKKNEILDSKLHLDTFWSLKFKKKRQLTFLLSADFFDILGSWILGSPRAGQDL